jgi:hypothetical protein
MSVASDIPSILTDLAYRRDLLIGRMVVDGWWVERATDIFLFLRRGADVPAVAVPIIAPNLDTVEDFRGTLDKAEAAFNRGKG